MVLVEVVSLTLPPSLHLVSMTILASLYSQIIRQKSSSDVGMGPWAAM